MQFLESQAVCDSQFAPFDNPLPCTSAVQPVFLIPQMVPRAKRQRLMKNETHNCTSKFSEVLMNRRKISKPQTCLETIAEVNEGGSVSGRSGSNSFRLENPLQRKVLVDTSSQCMEINWAEELKVIVSKCERGMTPIDAIFHCLPWIPEYIGLSPEVIRDAIEEKRKPLQKMYNSVGTQTNNDVINFAPVSRQYGFDREIVTSNDDVINVNYATQGRESFIDVVGMSDKGEEDIDSDATVPMFNDEPGRTMDSYLIEQHSNKENSEPSKVKILKGGSIHDNLLNMYYYESKGAVERNCENGLEERILVDDVVVDSLHNSPVYNIDATDELSHDDCSKEVVAEKSTVAMKYDLKIIVSGGIQSEDLSLLQNFFETFAYATLWKDFDEECTHLVILNSEGRLCKKRSLKYAWAVARSLPILCRDWLTDSIAKRKVAEIEDYEIVGDVCCDPNCNSSLRSRLNPCSLFSGFFLCFPSAYFEGSDVDRGGVCSAKIWDAHYQKDTEKFFIIFGIGCYNREAARRFEEDLKVYVITAEWIVDCLTQFTIFDASVYRILEI
uniref:BRCT domain-containing protein n=1 Tax=Syphacia muris TaxID=451379 RepID=A0A0N5B0R8_9BILA